ncbi:MAG TPA: helix-turn-helix domain-containing protein [Isosphaeraceae bacterium]|nr:helix-turn-helix domain-containing protein [Isosphaeraceae bacterium]
MPRPSLYTAARAETILAAILEGASQAEAARRAGVGRRTLQDWLAQGRSDRTGALGPFALRLDLRAEEARRRRIRAYWARYQAARAESWQRFRAGRQDWWRTQLGDREFWRRRLVWGLAKGREFTIRQAREKLAALAGPAPD